MKSAVRTITGFPNSDERVGDPQELRFSNEELRRADSGPAVRKTLVFEGNYTATPGQQPAMARANDRERSEQNSDRARIVGTVRVNGEAPVEVDAIAETSDAAKTKNSEK